MKKYNDLHKNLIWKVAEKILMERKIKINSFNKNNIILAWLTLWLIFFLILILVLVYKSWFIEYIKWSDETIILLKYILSFISLVLLFSIALFGYIFYIYNLFLIYKRKIIIWFYTINEGIKFFLIFTLFIWIFLLIYFYFDNKLVYLNSLTTKIFFKYIIYGYFWIFWISFIIFLIEYFYKIRKNYFDFWILSILTLFSPIFAYKLLTKNQKDIIIKGFNNVTNEELSEIYVYLIYWNKVENILRKIFLLSWSFYVIMKFIIWDFWLDYDKLYWLISNHFILSLEIFFTLIMSFFIFKLFFTPSFLRWAYYVYLKNNNKIDY